MKKVTRLGVSSVVFVAVSLSAVGCSSSPSEPPSTSVSREAGVLASELCILNGTTKTIHWVGELGPYENGDHHPDPAGPLAPGAKWCTNGYNAYSSQIDVAAEIIFTQDGSDRSNWGAYNLWLGGTGLRFNAGKTLNYTGDFDSGWSWETDVTLPSGYRPNHDYHIRRLDDTEFFKEWLVTVRR